MAQEPKPLINRIIGGILMFMCPALFVLPVFVEVKKDYTDHIYVPFLFLVVGALFYYRLNIFLTTSSSLIEKIIALKTKTSVEDATPKQTDDEKTN